jgi:hypothetical protein
MPRSIPYARVEHAKIIVTTRKLLLVPVAIYFFGRGRVKNTRFALPNRSYTSSGLAHCFGGCHHFPLNRQEMLELFTKNSCYV